MWISDKKNWTDAEDFCQKEGGHLASVHSNATNNFVLGGMALKGLDIVWLGGNDIKGEGVWQWTDCTPWDFTFWAPGEPTGGGEDCLTQVFNFTGYGHLDRKWNDWSCGSRYRGFLCSKKICSGRNYKSRNYKINCKSRSDML